MEPLLPWPGKGEGRFLVSTAKRRRAASLLTLAGTQKQGNIHNRGTYRYSKGTFTTASARRLTQTHFGAAV